jgi:hypothetical protein
MIILITLHPLFVRRGLSPSALCATLPYLKMADAQPLICSSKAIPLQAWTGPEGRRMRLPDFKTIGT